MSGEGTPVRRSTGPRRTPDDCSNHAPATAPDSSSSRDDHQPDGRHHRRDRRPLRPRGCRTLTRPPSRYRSGAALISCAGAPWLVGSSGIAILRRLLSRRVLRSPDQPPPRSGRPRGVVATRMCLGVHFVRALHCCEPRRGWINVLTRRDSLPSLVLGSARRRHPERPETLYALHLSGVNRRRL